MLLSDRINPKIFYEIYTVTAVYGISRSDIVGMFNNSPQHAADTIRKLGDKIYSDRSDVSKKVIV